MEMRLASLSRSDLAVSVRAAMMETVCATDSVLALMVADWWALAALAYPAAWEVFWRASNW